MLAYAKTDDTCKNRKRKRVSSFVQNTKNFHSSMSPGTEAIMYSVTPTDATPIFCILRARMISIKVSSPSVVTTEIGNTKKYRKA